MTPIATSNAISLIFPRVKDTVVPERTRSTYSQAPSSQNLETKANRMFHIKWPGKKAKHRTVKLEEAFNMTLDDFELLKVLGQGALGKIFMVRKHSNQKIYALKVIRKPEDKNKANDIISERNVLSVVDNPFIIKLYYAFHTSEFAFLVMNFASGGDLFHLIDNAPFPRFPENYARFYISEITLALEYLHSRKIVYRDLKAENILLDAEGHIQLADFGFATYLSKGTNTLCGTPEYVAPEMIMQQVYNETVDLWALGVLLYYLLDKDFPFIGKNPNVTLWKILYEEPNFPKDFSEEATDFCRELFQPDPQARLGSRRMGGIKKLKKHAFFTKQAGFNWADFKAKKVSPPFVPFVEGEADSRNFDDEITNLPLTITDISSPSYSSIEIYDDRDIFEGFNFTSSSI